MAIITPTQVEISGHYQDPMGDTSLGYSCTLLGNRNVGQTLEELMRFNGHWDLFSQPIQAKLTRITVGNGVNPPNAGLIWFHKSVFPKTDTSKKTPSYYEVSVIYHDQLCERVSDNAPIDAIAGLAYRTHGKNERTRIPKSQLIFGYRRWANEVFGVAKSLGNDMKESEIEMVIQKFGERTVYRQTPAPIDMIWFGLLNPMTRSFFWSPTDQMLRVINTIKQSQPA